VVYFAFCDNIPGVNQINDPKFKAITDRFFWESFFGIFIFGIPAFLAVALGQMLDARLSTGRLWFFVFLGVAFVLSWAIVFYRNKRVTKIYREFREGQKNSEPVNKAE